MKPRCALALLAVALFALCHAAAGDRADQVARVAAPRSVTFEAAGKAVKLEANTELYSVVVRDKKDADALAALQKDGKSPPELIVTDAGRVHVGHRADLKPAAELTKLARAGKLPPLYQAYKFQENVVLLDGTVVVKLSGKDQAGTFGDFCKKNKLTATVRKDAADTYSVVLEDAAAYADPFAAVAELAKLKYVKNAEPVFVILVKADDPAEKKDGKGKGDAKDKSKGDAKDKAKDKAKDAPPLPRAKDAPAAKPEKLPLPRSEKPPAPKGKDS